VNPSRDRTLSLCLLCGVLATSTALAGPYAPAAGQPGSSAIHKDDPAIVGWADGYADYQVGANVDPAWQTPSKALGPADGGSFDIVSLGRGGSITMTFPKPIADRAGPDLAVFENSINATFLELAFVEVSSNGTDFFRFDSDSLTAGPVGQFGSVDPTDVTGLASKYAQGYGTPFDLADLAGVSPLFNRYGVRYVRIVDVVGDGSAADASGDPIYDPYPTVGSAGFDLDAVAVLNEAIDGDANLNNFVEFGDVSIVADHFGAGGEFVDGDFTGDGFVDADDLDVLEANFGAYIDESGLLVSPAGVGLESFALDNVPEPGSLTLLGIAAMAVARRGHASAPAVKQPLTPPVRHA